MKKRNIFIIAIFTIFFLLLIISGIVVFKFINKNDKDSNNDIIIKKNVKVITNETEPERQPIKVTDDELIFSNNPHYSKEDVIVAGILDAAPKGFIRKVLSVEKDDSQYIVHTEYAVLTDVFEELHLTKNFVFTPDGINETDSNGQIGMSADFHNVTQAKAYLDKQTIDLSMISKLSTADDTNTDYLFYKEFEEEIKGNISLTGSVGFNVWEEMTFDISHNDIIFGMALHNETNGELFVGYNDDIIEEKKYQKEILKKQLPDFEFMISGIPFVVTNELHLDIKGDAKMEGTFGTSFGLESENTSGFLYNSKNNKVEDITKKEYFSNGLEWSTEAKMSGESSASALLHIVSKLYDCSGTDIAVGISGEANGEVCLSPNESIDGLNYAGSIELAIKPKLQGTLVVSVPVIDKKLIEQPLFRISLNPFWEKHWTSSENWELDLENADTTENTEELDYTYHTKFGDINMITYPQFAFDYLDGWTISQEEVTQNGETVILTNERGVTITFSHIGGVAEGELELGGSTTVMRRVNISKVADSKFMPSYVQGSDYSNLGKFMVAQQKVTGQLYMLLDSDFKDVDGAISYAVLPESRQGIDDDVRHPNIVQFAFWYSGYISFVAESPNGQFSANEEQELIKILSSFRVES